jgi:hypothetical protein
MRKICILLIAIFLIPINVFADTCNPDGITIQSIKMIEKSDSTRELTEAKANGTTLNLDIMFSKEKDFIKYKTTIKNNTEDDYVLDESMFNKIYNNVQYTFETNDKVVKAGTTKDLTLNVSLINTPTESRFKETNTFNLDLTGGKIENPPTGVKTLIYLIPILIVIGLMVFIITKKNNAFKMVAVILAFMIIIPTIVKAVCKCNMKINSTITVENCKYILRTPEGSFEPDKDTKEVCIVSEDILENYNKIQQRTMDESYSYNLGYYEIIYLKLKNKTSDIFFNDTSYIRVFSDPGKTNLIKTITKDDIYDHYYFLFKDHDIVDSDYLDSYAEIIIGNYEKIYFDISSDLTDKLELDIKYTNDNSIYTQTFENFEIISNNDIGNKVEYLRSHTNTGSSTMYFSNCKDAQGRYEHEYEFDESTVTCSGNIYYTIWVHK